MTIDNTTRMITNVQTFDTNSKGMNFIRKLPIICHNNLIFKILHSIRFNKL